MTRGRKKRPHSFSPARSTAIVPAAGCFPSPSVLPLWRANPCSLSSVGFVSCILYNDEAWNCLGYTKLPVISLSSGLDGKGVTFLLRPAGATHSQGGSSGQPTGRSCVTAPARHTAADTSGNYEFEDAKRCVMKDSENSGMSMQSKPHSSTWFSKAASAQRI